NKDFEDTIAVDRNAIEDDQYGVYSPMFRALGEAVAAHYDEMVWPLLKAGAKTLCYDGQNFFDTDHPVRGVGTAKNFFGAAGANGDASNAIKWYLMDLRRTFKPIVMQIRKRADNIVRKDRDEDENVFMRKEFVYGVDSRDNVGFGLWQMASACTADLTRANFTPVYSAMEELKGDEGRPLGLKPTHLIVPPSLREAATRLMENEFIPTADGNASESNPIKGWAEVVVVPWLA
ncbi:MAG: Mu-like prophage major head subunit gpT family protein, partial [Rhodospirillaceae bacterium]|nr:Mu-like prophage major head subunit gpT family protein [Rhodospirillaceae bacterium]